MAAILLVVVLGGVAYWRGGLLDLPSVPRNLGPEACGLADLDSLAARAGKLELEASRSSPAPDGVASAVNLDAPDEDPALGQAAAGLAQVRRGDLEAGLAAMRAAVELVPRDLVVGNAYRIAVLQLRRAALADTRVTLADRLPPPLAREPIAFFERLRREHPSREVTLQLALAWVDELMLFPALEIQAPASIESVKLLTELLAEDPWYVPALFGRGLNYLHRPSRLVWPEPRKAPPDAARHDVGLCIAIGRELGVARPRLAASLALTLGDAYVKEGKGQQARSWWQIAENTTRDPDLRMAVRRRFGWRDDQLLDQLEIDLEDRMLDLDHPLTDLSVMWR